MSFILYTECLGCSQTWPGDRDFCSKCQTGTWLIHERELPSHYE